MFYSPVWPRPGTSQCQLRFDYCIGLDEHGAIARYGGAGKSYRCTGDRAGRKFGGRYCNTGTTGKHRYNCRTWSYADGANEGRQHGSPPASQRSGHSHGSSKSAVGNLSGHNKPASGGGGVAHDDYRRERSQYKGRSADLRIGALASAASAGSHVGCVDLATTVGTVRGFTRFRLWNSPTAPDSAEFCKRLVNRLPGLRGLLSGSQAFCCDGFQL